MANRIQGTTRLIGLIGTPIKHSRSPHMHNSAFEKTGQDYAYLCLEVGKEGLKQALEALKLFNAKGSNITFPNKQEVIQYLDEISEDAKIIGSVNTITIDDETKKIKGYNTDGRGFVASIEDIQLAYEGVGELIIKDIDEALMKEVKETINKGIQNCKVKLISDEDALKEELKDAVLLINATPLGMKGRVDMCAISSSDVLDNTKVFVYDIVYEPRETKLMKYAKEKGLQTTNGINMMLWQGALAYKIWLGVDMPIDYVRGELFEG